MMNASQPQPGTTVGPTFAGAAGQAGLGQLASNRQRETAAASAAFAREKFETEKEQFGEEQATKNREIESDERLRMEIEKSRAEARQLSNEIAQQGNQIRLAGDEADERRWKTESRLRIKEALEDKIEWFTNFENYDSPYQNAEGPEEKARVLAKYKKTLKEEGRQEEINLGLRPGRASVEAPGQPGEDVKVIGGTQYRVK